MPRYPTVNLRFSRLPFVTWHESILYCRFKRGSLVGGRGHETGERVSLRQYILSRPIYGVQPTGLIYYMNCKITRAGNLRFGTGSGNYNQIKKYISLFPTLRFLILSTVWGSLLGFVRTDPVVVTCGDHDAVHQKRYMVLPEFHQEFNLPSPTTSEYSLTQPTSYLVCKVGLSLARY